MKPEQASEAIQAVIVTFEYFHKTLEETDGAFRDQTTLAPIKIGTAIKTLRQMRQHTRLQIKVFQENFSIDGLLVASYFCTLDGRQTASLILWLEEFRMSSTMSTTKRIEMHLELEEQLKGEIRDIEKLLKELQTLLKQFKLVTE